MSEPVKGRCICEHDRSRHEAGAQECRVGACHCPFFRQEDEISIGLREGTLRFVSEDESGGQQQAAAPKAPLDPKVGQMSEDAKAFGPAAQPSDEPKHLPQHETAPFHDYVHVTSDGEGTLCILARGFTTIRACMDCGVLIAGGPTRCLPCAAKVPATDRPPSAVPAGNAEGAKALEIARAEGKAEGLEAAARIAAEWCSLPDCRCEQAQIRARIRSLIPAAPGGGGK